MMMFNDRMSKFAHITLIALICGMLTPLALAQDDDSLRRENEELKQQVYEARNRIAELERQIQRLNASLNQNALGEELLSISQAKVTIDESKPDASPRALFAVLKGEFEEVIAELDMDKSDNARRITYRRTVERWINRANRKHNMKIEWHVTFFERPLSPNPDRIKLLAVDPVTHTVLGEPFFVPVTRQLARQLNKIELRNELNVFVMKGVLTPRLRFNENAIRPNPFNPSQFLGQFVEFNYTIEPLNFLSAKENEEGEGTG